MFGVGGRGRGAGFQNLVVGLWGLAAGLRARGARLWGPGFLLPHSVCLAHVFFLFDLLLLDQTKYWLFIET